ncbi:MAG: hypothetical protein WD844_10750 [Thermoleophilaceae bacterium]
MSVRVALQSHVRNAGGMRRWAYLGEDTAWRIEAERGPLADAEPVRIGERIERISQELRRPYIDWVGELSQANSSLEWWASELAAKNPFTMLYSRICALACARELLAEGLDDALLVCSTPALARAVVEEAGTAGRSVTVQRGSAGALSGDAAGSHRERLRPLVDRVAAGLPLALARRAGRGPAAAALRDAPAYRRRVAQALGDRRDGGFAGNDAVLLVTWADGRSVGPDGRYRDPHLGSLGDLLESHGRRVAYLPRLLPGAPVHETLSSLLSGGVRVFLPETWIGNADWRDAAAVARSFQPQIPAGAEIGGVPVAGLAREHVDRFRRAQAWALAQAALIRNLAAGGVRPGSVVLPFEGHAWEQAVTAAVHEYMPGTRVIGYDNVNFSRLALSLYPAESELGIRPLPDVVVTNGPAFARILAGEGFPEERIRVGCGLRHEYVWADPGEPDAAPPGEPLRILAAGSIDAGQTVELVEKAVAAFGSEGFQVTVKLHPAVNRHAVMSRLSAPGRAADFREEPISELLRSADVLLYAYSVVCYEALAHGVAPVFVKAESFLDLDQLEPFPELGQRARTVEELQAAAEQVAALGEEDRRRWRERARAALAEALAPVEASCAAPFLEP